ncbi:hypothetical protein REPUB_Repub15cG0045300 [Reevesia pubescens]
MASNSLLLGPPGLHSNDVPMVDSIQADVDSLQLNAVKPIIPKLGFPKNESFMNSNTANPCLDLFFFALPSTPRYALVNLLQKAWSYDPLITLKLVCNLRGVRGTGKSDKEGFYAAALWLHKNHPKTLVCNVRVFAEFGCYKDLLEILYRLSEGENARENEKKECHRWLNRKIRNSKRKKGRWLNRKIRNSTRKPQFPRDFMGSQKTKKASENKENANSLRKEMQLNKAKKAYERYFSDPMYRLLHDCIADMFAEDLKKDIEFLNSGEVRKVGLASKWCPSINSAYDKATLICESIGRRMFPRESDPDYEGIEESHYAFRVRDRLRKQVLVPLHKALELPELYMSSKQWDSLPYNRVPSVAMKNYKNHFLSHDNQRFCGHIEDVRKEDETIAAGALLPHEIISSLKDAQEVAELQWRRMVEGLKNKGKLNNCIAVCDVSGRMAGTPMEVCVALGLLISELCEEPWKGKVITFGSNPELHMIQGDSLLSKTQVLRKLDRGIYVDFEEVFDRILKVAIDGKLKEDQMIKRIFVFSGMEFNEASRQNYNHNISNYSNGKTSGYYNPFSYSDTYSEEDYMLLLGDEDDWYAICEREVKVEEKQRKFSEKSWESMYEGIQRKFQDNGLKMPEIVFWNLKNSAAMPVPSNQGGVALVSGFSKNLMELFLDNGGIIDPVTLMEQAISGELYQKLSLYD